MKGNRRIKELGSDSNEFYVDMLAVCKQLHDQINNQSSCVISYGNIIQTSLGQRSDAENLESITNLARLNSQPTIRGYSYAFTQQSIKCRSHYGED